MRLFTAARCLSRAKCAPAFGTISCLSGFAHASTLSGIHKGLRRTDNSSSRHLDRITAGTRLRPDDPEDLRIQRSSVLGPQRGRTRVNGSDVSKPQTRKARFNDPTSSFGKNSHVHQLRHSQFAQQLREPASGGPGVFDGSRGMKRGTAREDTDSQQYGTSGFPISRTLQAGALRTPREEYRDAPNRENVGRPGQAGWLSDTRDSGRETTHDPEHQARTPSFRLRSAGSLVSVPRATAASQFVYGKSMVKAALLMGRRKFYKLYMQQAEGAELDSEQKKVLRLAKKQSLEVEMVGSRGQSMLDRMCAGRPHNGYVLEASPLSMPPVKALGAGTSRGIMIELDEQSREDVEVNGSDTTISVDKLADAKSNPLVVLLDQVLDPGNLGAIVRSASYLGANLIAVSRSGSATLTSVALKAAAGATEVVPIVSVESPASFLEQSRKAGWKVFAAVPPKIERGWVNTAPLDKSVSTLVLEQSDPLGTGPCILVMGGEGAGLSRALRAQADVEVSIPNHSISLSIVDSLNVSVAMGILCAAFVRGREAGHPSRAVPDDAGAIF